VPTGERDAPVEPLQLADGGKEHYLGILTWLPDSSELLFFKLRRDFKSFTLLAAKPTGTTVEVRELFTEWQRSFIKGIATNPGILSLLTPLPERRQFLWISERDGWDHLYLYDLDTGQPLRRLTAGQWPVLQVVAVDEEEGWVYFTAHPARGAGHPYDTHVHRVALDRRNAAGYPQTDRLTEGGGVHQPLFAPGARHFLDLHSAPDQPPTVTLRRSDGTAVATVETADASPLQAAGWRPPEPVTVTAADRHTELHGLLYRPFQPQAEPLPLIDAVYGGPQTLRTRWDFVGDPDACALAQSGFAVLLLDGRGTPERGKHFQDHVYGRLGQFEMDDHAAALRQLGEREDLDGERVGIYGGSWGGYFTFRALLTHPDLFDVGVAINGVAEVTGVAAMGVEPYLGGPPRKAREAYAAASNLPHAGALQGRLLVIHSTRDSNAPIGSVMKLLDAFNRAEKRYDLLLFPDEHHHVNPALRPYLQRRLREYFEEHL
jgi:dipeptidyl aminopeptidase/acylaminoacyl peptidase